MMKSKIRTPDFQKKWGVSLCRDPPIQNSELFFIVYK